MKVGDGEDTGGAVDRFHKSRIKSLPVLTSFIEYVSNRTDDIRVSPEDV